MTSHTAPRHSLEDNELVRSMATAANLQPSELVAAIRRQLISIKSEITVGDMIALFVTAKEYGLNPLRREVSLIDTKAGPRVYVMFDGWLRVLVSHPRYVNHAVVIHWVNDKVGTVATAVTAKIKRKLSDGTVEWYEHTELLQECRVANDYTPWNKYPVRMLTERAIMQCVRFCFGMYVPTLEEMEEINDLEGKREGAQPPDPAQVGPVIPIPPKTAPPAVAALPEPAEPIAMRIPPTAARAQPATLPGFDPEESRRIDAETLRREGGAADKGFEDLDIG